jgi:YD repeat-containing protein
MMIWFGRKANSLTQPHLVTGTVSGRSEQMSGIVAYKPLGPVTAMTFGDGASQGFTHDQEYQATGVIDQAGARTLRQLSYTRGPRGNLVAVTDALVPANSESFVYTPRESLETATGPYGSLAFTYDGVGNRVTYKVGTATDSYTYPLTSNRLGSISLAAGGSRAFTYDAAGNVISDNRGAGFGYTYDSGGAVVGAADQRGA